MREPPKGWAPSVDQVTQLCHFALGLVFLFAPAAVFGRTLWCAAGGFFAALVFAALKEFVFDIRVEEDSWANSFEDFRFYALGAYTGLFVSLLGVWLNG